jgi:hypothetical protein
VSAGRAADLAQGAGEFAGWVNNAAIFRDAWLDAVPAREIVPGTGSRGGVNAGSGTGSGTAERLLD